MRLAVVLLFLAAGCLAVVRGPNRNTSEIIIEVDWTTDAPPPGDALRAAEAALEGVFDPAVDVRFELDESLPGHAFWSDFDVRRFAFEHRSMGEFYMIWAAGGWSGIADTGGYSWSERCFAVFPEEYAGRPACLPVVIQHELLHCLGLVGKYLATQSPHQQAVDHCTHKGCIMWPTTEAGAVLCPACIADLEAGERN